MNAAQAAAAAEEAQLSVEQSKLPLFHAEPGKDQFTGDQWLERFEKCRQAGNWNEARTTSYFYNSMRGKALKWYRMLSVAKINANDYAQLRMAFVESYGTQASQRVVITDFMSIKQGKTEPVQEYFSRIGDTSYNYKVKKPNADIRGPCIVVPEHRREALAEYMALPLAVRQEVHELEYEQFNNNDVSYLGLQFFIAGLHPDIQLDVIRRGQGEPIGTRRSGRPRGTGGRGSRATAICTKTNVQRKQWISLPTQDGGFKQLRIRIKQRQRESQRATSVRTAQAKSSIR